MVIRYQSKSENTMIEHIEQSIFGVKDQARLFFLHLTLNPKLVNRNVSSVYFLQLAFRFSFLRFKPAFYFQSCFFKDITLFSVRPLCLFSKAFLDFSSYSRRLATIKKSSF